MRLLLKILAGAVPAAGVCALLACFLLLRCLRRRRQSRREQQQKNLSNPSFNELAAKSLHDASPAAVPPKLHHSHKGGSVKNSLRFHHIHCYTGNDGDELPSPAQTLAPPPFNWDAHPRLISDAVEFGWSRFAFAPLAAANSPSPPILSHFCASAEQDTSWDLPMGSSEFMQTVRLNPKRTAADNGYASLRMSLPLPGPNLGISTFPQEAYFEITILYLQPVQHRQSRAGKKSKDAAAAGGESDRAKLIQDNSTGAQSDALVYTLNTGGGSAGTVVPDPEHNSPKQEDGKSYAPVISLGLTKASQPFPGGLLLGMYPGSVCYNSTGSVLLDGIKLVFESEKTEWSGVNRVIGCGYNPIKKKVFLTLDSELVHVIHCSSDAFKSPLYPVLAANADVMMLVNLGQSLFKYTPANGQRTPNPCFIHSSLNTNVTDGVLGHVDSQELFSMEKLDKEWMVEADMNKNKRKGKGSTSSDDEEGIMLDTESDLFEIVLHS